MNTEEELLADALIEIISWVKSSTTDEARPLLVREMVAYGRSYLTFIYLLLIACFSVSAYVGVSAFKSGVDSLWDQRTKWLPQLSLCVAGLIISMSLIVALADNLMRVWFSPRMYVIEKLTEIVVYK